jgi:serine/threonine protein phosphatase PrpC
VGAVRERNEDAVYVDPQGQLFIVADGMGGHAAGDVASALAIDVVRTRLEVARDRLDAARASGNRPLRVKPLLASAVRAAHEALRKRTTSDPTTAGMGSTIDVAIVLGDRVLIAHVGDSRTYLIRGRRVIQLTRDHTVAQAAVDAGRLTAAEARRSPHSSVLTNVLGIGDQVTVDLVERTLRPGDRLLLCTDGLYDGLTPSELEAAVSVDAPEHALADLIAMALRRGGHDNATGVLVEALGATAPDWDDEPTIPRQPSPTLGTATPDIVAANPLAKLTDETLSGIVDLVIHEESGPTFR